MWIWIIEDKKKLMRKNENKLRRKTELKKLNLVK
jgi:hypothetical protein